MKIDPENTSIETSGAEGNQFTHRTATHVYRMWIGKFGNDWAMLAGVCEKCGFNPADFKQNHTGPTMIIEGNDIEEFEACLDLMCPKRTPLCRVAIKIKKREEEAAS